MIAELDLELKQVTYHKIHHGMPFSRGFNMIGKDTCVGSSLTRSIDYRKEYKALKIFNFKTQAETFFFDKMPVDGIKPKDVAENPVFLVTLSPRIGIDYQEKRIIVSFTRPDNPIDFYIHSFSGDLIDHFSFNFDPSYSFPEYFRTNKNPPKQFRLLILSSIFIHRGYYILIINSSRFTDYHKGEYVSERYCVILDKESRKLKQKISIPPYMEFFTLSEDGYIIGTDPTEDTVKAYIYKLE